MLSNFSVVHVRSSVTDDPLVHAHADAQLVLAYIAREALDDYFRVPGGQPRTIQQWNLVVEANLARFAKIISEKYENDEWAVHNAYGQSYPRITVTLHDMQRSGEQFTDDVLNLRAGFQDRR